jgi:predicted MFS family arabinose efflux permease
MKIFNKKEFYLFMCVFMIFNSLAFLASGFYVLEVTDVNIALILGLYFAGMFTSVTFYQFYKQMKDYEKHHF